MYQPDLFDSPEPPTPPQPRKPHHAKSCMCPACNGPKLRTCKVCGTHYRKDVDTDAGTKYCSTACKRIGYGLVRDKAKPERTHFGDCARCGAPWSGKRTYPLCNDCYVPLKGKWQMLTKHRVPLPLLLAFMAHPHCQICGANISDRRKTSAGKWRTSAVVDHDHSCCKGSTSCGRCVRGILCDQCNHALGSAYDDPARLRAMADYLEKRNGGA